MALLEGDKTELRKLLLPGAAGVAGVGAGLALTRSRGSSRQAIPSLDDLGLGDLIDDLRDRLSAVLGRETSSGSVTSSSSRQKLDNETLERRRRERAERRAKRQGRS